MAVATCILLRTDLYHINKFYQYLVDNLLDEAMHLFSISRSSIYYILCVKSGIYGQFGSSFIIQSKLKTFALFFYIVTLNLFFLKY